METTQLRKTLFQTIMVTAGVASAWYSMSIFMVFALAKSRDEPPVKPWTNIIEWSSAIVFSPMRYIQGWDSAKQGGTDREATSTVLFGFLINSLLWALAIGIIFNMTVRLRARILSIHKTKHR